jgi:hypothetical protein
MSYGAFVILNVVELNSKRPGHHAGSFAVKEPALTLRSLFTKVVILDEVQNSPSFSCDFSLLTQKGLPYS